MYKRRDVKWREEGDGIVIFCPRRSRLFKLNSTASKIWKVLEIKSIKEIAKDISATYNISVEEAQKDVEACMADLISKELITKSND